MSERQETIADIIAWLRRPREGENAYLTLWRDEIADRLEAAWKREREVTKPAENVNSGAASDNRDNSGNCAKLRVALETLRELLEDLLRLEDAEYHNDFSNFCDIINAALAAPPRNCDVYDNESCRMAYHLHGDGSMTMQSFADWLFAPATAKEGGAK